MGLLCSGETASGIIGPPQRGAFAFISHWFLYFHFTVNGIILVSGNSEETRNKGLLDIGKAEAICDASDSRAKLVREGNGRIGCEFRLPVMTVGSALAEGGIRKEIFTVEPGRAFLF